MVAATRRPGPGAAAATGDVESPPRRRRRLRRRSAACLNDAGEFVAAAKDGGYSVFVDSSTLGAAGTGGNFGLVRLGAERG